MSIQSPAKYEIHAIHLKLINYGNGIIDHASVYKGNCEVKSEKATALSCMTNKEAEELQRELTNLWPQGS